MNEDTFRMLRDMAHSQMGNRQMGSDYSIIPRGENTVSDNKFVVEYDTKVTWADIGGQEEAKEAIQEILEWPLQHKELYTFYNKKRSKGILLSGPPGCGKTMLGKAAVSSISKFGDGNKKSSFMYVKASELLHRLVGETESKIRGLFETASNHLQRYQMPMVIFIDEADSFLMQRGPHTPHWHDSHVAAFLTEMDGLHESSAFVILATNQPNTIDEAVLRPGRIDAKIKVTRPSQKDAGSICELYLKNIPLFKKLSKSEVVHSIISNLYSYKYLLATIQSGEEKMGLYLSALISGAFIANVVQTAQSIAFKRDLRNNERKGTGVCVEDVVFAVESIYRQNKDLDHKEVIKELLNGRSCDRILKVA